jgi:hypothetical protein
MFREICRSSREELIERWRKLHIEELHNIYSSCSILSLSSLSLFPVAPTMEHRASMKRFVSLQFHNPETVGRAPWMGDQPIARPLPIQTQTNIHTLSGIWTHCPRVRAGEDSSSSIISD